MNYLGHVVLFNEPIIEVLELLGDKLHLELETQKVRNYFR